MYKVRDLVWMQTDFLVSIQAKYKDKTGLFMLGVVLAVQPDPTFNILTRYTIGILAKDGGRWYAEDINDIMLQKFVPTKVR